MDNFIAGCGSLISNFVWALIVELCSTCIVYVAPVSWYMSFIAVESLCDSSRTKV